jgi:hypothetical protein
MSLIKALEQWNEDRKVDLIKSYRQSGLKASGRWERELSSKVEDKGSRIKVLIEGAAYTEQLIRGRKPTTSTTAGNPTLRQAIRQWIDDKPINTTGISKDSLAFLIARKIHRYGIRVPNKYNDGIFIDRVFYNEQGTLNQFKGMLATHFAAEMKKEITQGL